MTTKNFDDVLTTTRDARGVVTLTLNDPARFNALGAEMLSALQQALDDAGRDESVRVVVLAAAGKAFCAGHNLKDMAANPELAYYQKLFAQCSRMMLTIHKLPVPVIARVQGMATAAGCQLVAQCDLAVAADSASFATSGIHYGLFCATPSVPLVRNVPAKRAMEMLLTGDFIDAPTALAQGLLNRVVPADALDAEVEKLVESILQKPRVAVAMGKALVYQQRELGIDAAYQLAGQTMATTETPMLEDVGRWAEAFLRPTVLVEFAALAACLGLAWLLVSLLQRGLHRGDPRSILFGTRIVDGALFPLALLCLAYVARTVLLQWVPLAVFKVAVPVLVSLVVIRIGVKVLQVAYPDAAWVRPIERSISWLAWLGMVLWVTGLLPLVLEE